VVSGLPSCKISSRIEGGEVIACFRDRSGKLVLSGLWLKEQEILLGVESWFLVLPQRLRRIEM